MVDFQPRDGWIQTRRSHARRQARFDSCVDAIRQRDVRDLANIERLSEIPRLLEQLASRAGELLNHGRRVYTFCVTRGSQPVVDPVIEVYKKDIDRTLLRENLKLGVEERLRQLMELQRFAEELQRAGRAARRAS